MNFKRKCESFALFGGTSTFDSPVGTSGLYRPEFDQFLHYSRQFFPKLVSTVMMVLLSVNLKVVWLSFMIRSIV